LTIGSNGAPISAAAVSLGAADWEVVKVDGGISIITLFEATLWITAVVVLMLGCWFPRTRLGRGRWLAAGMAILEPGQLLTTYAEHHEWSPRRQIAVNDFELICDLAYVLCAGIFLIQSARPRGKSGVGRTARVPDRARAVASPRRP
jgi:hypothetical protein